jgi:hypothetical protein
LRPRCARFALPAHAVTVTFCGPENGTGCEATSETQVFLSEGHDETFDNGTVGSKKTDPVIHIQSDTGAFDINLDTGGGFATINTANADHKTFTSFNGVDITIPGYTFTDIVFSAQLQRAGGHKGDSEVDDFRIDAFSGKSVLDGMTTEKVSPDGRRA